MGRKTWESIPEKFRPLPNRTNVVVTRHTDLVVPAGVEVYHTIDEALNTHAKGDVMVIGGGEMYRQTFDQADTLYITEVHQTIEGDVFFPEIDKKVWKEMEREEREGLAFVTYVRTYE